MEIVETLLVEARASMLGHLESQIREVEVVREFGAREILINLLIHVEMVGEIQALHRSVLRLLYGQEIEQIEEKVVQYQAINGMLTTLGKHPPETIRKMALEVWAETGCPYMAAVAIIA